MSVDALHSVAVDAGRVGVVPVGRQMAEDLAPERWRELAEALADDDGMWVLDAGTGPAWEAAAVPWTRSVLVVRNCYLALRRAVQSPVCPSAVVLIEEAGRALCHPEVEAALPGLPVVVVPADPAVARAIDAGLLSAQLPASLGAGLTAING